MLHSGLLVPPAHVYEICAKIDTMSLCVVSTPVGRRLQHRPAVAAVRRRCCNIIFDRSCKHSLPAGYKVFRWLRLGLSCCSVTGRTTRVVALLSGFPIAVYMFFWTEYCCIYVVINFITSSEIWQILQIKRHALQTCWCRPVTPLGAQYMHDALSLPTVSLKRCTCTGQSGLHCWQYNKIPCMPNAISCPLTRVLQAARNILRWRWPRDFSFSCRS